MRYKEDYCACGGIVRFVEDVYNLQVSLFELPLHTKLHFFARTRIKTSSVVKYSFVKLKLIRYPRQVFTIREVCLDSQNAIAHLKSSSYISLIIKTTEAKTQKLLGIYQTFSVHL